MSIIGYFCPDCGTRCADLSSCGGCKKLARALEFSALRPWHDVIEVIDEDGVESLWQVTSKGICPQIGPYLRVKFLECNPQQVIDVSDFERPIFRPIDIEGYWRDTGWWHRFWGWH